MKNLIPTWRRPFLLLLTLAIVSNAALSQTSGTAAPADQPSGEAKAEAIIKSATAAVGGDAYLNVHSVVGRGFYTTYQDGASLLPTQVFGLHCFS